MFLLKINYINAALVTLSGLINLPFYWLSQLVPKNNHLWLFASRQGRAYSENSKYFFEYIKSNHPEYRVYWITKSLRISRKLKRAGYPVIFAYSPSGYYLSARAGAVFISNFKRLCSDYNDYATSPKTRIFQLWHGSPIKKIGNLRPVSGVSELDSLSRRALKTVFPFIQNRTSCHKFLAASPCVADSVRRAFSLSERHIWISGYPKNDPWLAKARSMKINKDHRKVLFIPTWRRDNNRLFIDYGFDASRLDEFCINNGIRFDIKIHHYDCINADILESINSARNIKLLECDDIYEVLHEYSILVTDYSSVLFDFLLSGRPVIFTPYDLDQYIKNDVGFIYDYKDITSCGSVANNWQQLERSLLDDHSAYDSARESICHKFNSENSANSNEKLLKLVEQQFSEEPGLDRAYHH